MIVEIEGIDGVGKTTQCRLLKKWYEDHGMSARVVKDLDATELGRRIKSFLVTDAPRTSEVELFAFLACKASLVSEVLRPELERGSIIICDRGLGSFLSYFEPTGFSRAFLQEMLDHVLSGGYKAQTFLIDVEVGVAFQRNIAKQEWSKFDKMDPEFFANQRHVLLDLASERGWDILDGTRSIEELQQEITQILRVRLK